LPPNIVGCALIFAAFLSVATGWILNAPPIVVIATKMVDFPRIPLVLAADWGKIIAFTTILGAWRSGDECEFQQ
jgi:hypothetical protein